MATRFQREKARILAQELKKSNGEDQSEMESGNPILAALLKDFRVDLKHSQSLESKSAKEEFKAERLSHYKPWVEGILENEEMPYDKITTEMAAWAVDGGDIDYALDIAHYMIQGEHNLPVTFTEKTPTALLRLFVDKAAKDHDSVTIEHLQTLETLFANVDVKDKVRAKLYRYIAERFTEDEVENIVKYYEKALAVNPGETVKTELKKAQAKVEANQIEQQQQEE